MALSWVTSNDINYKLDEINDFLGKKYGARVENLSGKIAETRNKALEIIDSDIVVFVDTDQVAPESWLETITAPIRSGICDFTGGPTKHYPPKSSPETYMDELEDYMYANLVSRDVRFLPMGNSAWNVKIFKKIGGFNSSLLHSEDYDINFKAVEAGFRGCFIEDAWVYHDHSDISSYDILIRKRYRYLKSTVKVYRMHKFQRLKLPKLSGKHIKHPFVIIEMMMKFMVLIDSLIRP